MGIAAFDTFEVAQSFEKVGFPKDQVAALTKAFVSVRSDPEAVSKAELREHKTEVKANIEKQESKILHAIEGLRHEMLDLRKELDSKFESQRKDMELQKKDIINKITAVVMGAGGLMLAAIKLL